MYEKDCVGVDHVLYEKGLAAVARLQEKLKDEINLTITS